MKRFLPPLKSEAGPEKDLLDHDVKRKLDLLFTVAKQTKPSKSHRSKIQLLGGPEPAPINTAAAATTKIAHTLKPSQKPRKPPSPFLMFFRTERAKLAKEMKNVPDDEIDKLVKERWRNISVMQKANLEAKYNSNLETYKIKLNLFEAKSKMFENGILVEFESSLRTKGGSSKETKGGSSQRTKEGSSQWTNGGSKPKKDVKKTVPKSKHFVYLNNAYYNPTNKLEHVVWGCM